MTDELKWENSLSSALELAKNEKKRVLVDFYGPS
jgi:hypothetical protein